MSSYPTCSKCGSELNIDVITPCPQCEGVQGAGDADCWACGGMGQVSAVSCDCSTATPARGPIETGDREQ